MLKDFVPRRPAETTHFELVFRLEDRRGSAFRFECDDRRKSPWDEHGNVFRDRLPELALHNLRLCLQGEVDGYRVRAGAVESYTQNYIEEGGGACVCGSCVVIHSAWANICESCDREYNGSDQLLAAREFWGEETGESVFDMEHDPEGCWE